LTLKVFITGASTGIGEALAVYYAGQGAALGLAARRAEFLDALNRRLGGTHATFALDVRDAPALRVAAEDFIARFGAPDIVIANAGVSAGTLTEHAEDLEVFRQIMDTNVFGMAATFAPFIPALRAARRALSTTFFMSHGERNCPFLKLTGLPVSATAVIRSVCRHSNAGICNMSTASETIFACQGSCTSVRTGR